MNSVFLSERLTERNLIESILSSFYIIDYGFIKNINPDDTIDVTHAKQLKTYDDKTLPATVTTKIEVLTLSAGGFSFKIDYKKGDKVLLLGLKDYVPKVKDVTQATETKTYLHYTRETIKAIPMCVFNEDAKVTVEIEDGNANVKTEGHLKLNTKKETIIDADKIELNGKDKQLVTWAELNQALSDFMQALNSHTHTSGGSGSPTSAPVTPMTLDISEAKTTTVVTGG